MAAPETVVTQTFVPKKAEHLSDEAYEAELAELARAQTSPDTEEGAQVRERGLSELYIRHYPSVMARALYYTKHHEDAENVAQEVFLNMFRKIDHFENEGQGLKPWLYRITHNQFVTEYRKSRRRPVVFLDAEEAQNLSLGGVDDTGGEQEQIRIDSAVEAAHDAVSSPELSIPAQVDFYRKVSDWIENIGRTSAKRATLLERLSEMALYSQGYHYTEIAEMRGIALGTVMSRLSRVRGDIKDLESLAS
jgi:RNA polymerase sigma-70 factor (ECF subfamily)